jgi:DNA-cytosine methyltransferase
VGATGTGITAIEFFSGIGGFAAVAAGAGIEVVQAFDQDRSANVIYAANFSRNPDSTNLDSIKGPRIANADLWWLSPPCTPYTTRGAQKDLADSRAASLVNLLNLVGQCKPTTIVIENVVGFLQSDAHRLTERILKEHDYLIHTLMLCSSDFNVPMRRPRVFLYAVQMPSSQEKWRDKASALKEIAKQYAQSVKPDLKRSDTNMALCDFIRDRNAPDLQVDSDQVERYKWCMDIVDANEVGRNVICFTSGYGQFFRSSGSFLQVDEFTVRRFSPREILSLLGFHEHFVLPDSINLQKQWKLVGNSLDLRCVQHVLSLDKIARDCLQ